MTWNFWNANTKEGATNYDWYGYSYHGNNHNDNKIPFHFNATMFIKNYASMSTYVIHKRLQLLTYLFEVHNFQLHIILENRNVLLSLRKRYLEH